MILFLAAFYSERIHFRNHYLKSYSSLTSLYSKIPCSTPVLKNKISVLISVWHQTGRNLNSYDEGVLLPNKFSSMYWEIFIEQLKCSFPETKFSMASFPGQSGLFFLFFFFVLFCNILLAAYVPLSQAWEQYKLFSLQNFHVKCQAEHCRFINNNCRFSSFTMGISLTSSKLLISNWII